MRAIWKGAVSFGLVSVPVKLYAATESHDISFRQVHAKDGGRIKYQRVCSIDGEEVAYADIAKGYQTEDGEIVILDDEDLAQLPAASSREISVEKFVPSDQIDPMMLEKSYYLEPEKSGLKPYALLRDALRESDRVAVVTVAIRTRMTPAVLRVRDDVLVLQTLMWPDEIREPDFGSLKDVEPAKPQELKMAQLLLETLAGDYDPDDFEDDYAAAVHALVEAKLEGGEVARTATEAPSAGEVVDLLAALQKSVAAAKTARGEEPEDEDAEEEAEDEPAAKRGPDRGSGGGQSRRTAKQAGEKKPAAKKAADKRTADKKSATRKRTADKKSEEKPAKRSSAKKTAAKRTAAKKADARSTSSRARKSA